MNPGDLTRFRKLAWAAAGALADLPFYAHPAIAEAECPMCHATPGAGGVVPHGPVCRLPLAERVARTLVPALCDELEAAWRRIEELESR
jgi:hypothetical protein